MEFSMSAHRKSRKSYNLPSLNIVRNTNCGKYIFLTRPLDQDVKNFVNIKNYKEVQTINNLTNCEIVNLQYGVDNSLLTELRNNKFGKTLKKSQE